MEATITIAERLLTERFGDIVRLGSGNDLDGSARARVQRFPVLAGPASAPTSVIVKQADSEVFDATLANNAAWLLFNDWASLQFLPHIGMPTPCAPAFYGGDKRAGLVVMEDLGAGMRLDHLLLGHDAQAAEAGLLAYAELHGRLHARTMDKQAEYLRIRELLGVTTSSSQYYIYDGLTPALHAITELLEIPLQSAVDDEMVALTNAMSNPGPFLTFVQADAAPDNILHDGTNWRLIDFEGSRYAHALLEGVYCRMPFPTCWCVYHLPEALMQRAEAVYRAELVQACPAAADDTLFYHAVVEACITWALNFHRHMRSLEKMLVQDRSLVALTDRQRFLLYINAAVHASEQFAHMQATGASLRAIATKLAQLWPAAIEPPYYPAFSET